MAARSRCCASSASRTARASISPSPSHWRISSPTCTGRRRSTSRRPDGPAQPVASPAAGHRCRQRPLAHAGDAHAPRQRGSGHSSPSGCSRSARAPGHDDAGRGRAATGVTYSASMPARAVAVLEEIPQPDDAGLGILDVEGVIAAPCSIGPRKWCPSSRSRRCTASSSSRPTENASARAVRRGQLARLGRASTLKARESRSA